MRLLYITNQISAAAGLERVLSIKTSALADDFNHEVHIITLNQKEKKLFYPFSDKIIFHNMTTPQTRVLFYFYFFKELKSLIKKINPDCISVCDDGLKGFFIPYFIPRNSAIIYERHASKFISLNSNSSFSKIKFAIITKLMNFGAKKFDVFVVLTENNLKEWPLMNMKVIPNPLPFFPSDQSKLKNKEIIAVGSHYHQKGFDILLNIWNEISSKFPEWKLNIFGKSDKNKTYINFAKKLGIQNSVNFYEPVKNIGLKYKEASIYTMTSRSEGFGMVLIEAMSFGLPCIAFDCPSGPRDIIENDKNGYLIPLGDVKEYQSKLVSLMKNYELRLRLGNYSRKSIEEYLPENIFSKWNNLFLTLKDKT